MRELPENFVMKTRSPTDMHYSCVFHNASRESFLFFFVINKFHTLFALSATSVTPLRFMQIRQRELALMQIILKYIRRDFIYSKKLMCFWNN